MSGWWCTWCDSMQVGSAARCPRCHRKMTPDEDGALARDAYRGIMGRRVGHNRDFDRGSDRVVCRNDLDPQDPGCGMPATIPRAYRMGHERGRGMLKASAPTDEHRGRVAHVWGCGCVHGPGSVRGPAVSPAEADGGVRQPGRGSGPWQPVQLPIPEEYKERGVRNVRYHSLPPTVTE